MFSQNSEYEEDFCEAYKSQILNKDSNEKESSFNVILKILTILLLLAIIIAISIYSYSYFTKQNISELSSPPTSIQISDDDLVVQEEDSEEDFVIENKIEEQVTEEVKSLKVEHLSKKENVSISSQDTIAPEIQTPALHMEEADIDQIANDVKLAIANSELEEENAKNKMLPPQVSQQIQEETNQVKKSEKNLEIPPASLEEQYLEELADLSRQIDKERR